MTQNSAPPNWRRPPGLAKGTWEYVHQRSIARHYDDFVADTPLCQLDQQYVERVLADVRREQSAGHQEKLLESRPLILDLGCGTGRLALPVSESGCDVLAIDLSQPMLCELRQRCPAPAGGQIWPIHANLVQLQGLRDGIADHAICMFSTLGMIQARQNRIEFLRHVARIVKPNGTFVVHVHRRWAGLRESGGWRRLAGSWLHSLRDRESEFGDATYPYRGLQNMFMHRFSGSELRSELAAAGWRLDRLDRVDLQGQRLTQSRWNSSGYFAVCTAFE
ncbi:methyltransferase domain-containing protein [Stieleria sp. TO1_6]|uniref:class I SAM-dependent methyltransferase n=1 Tax=Stieleria tagensis TaxID=2956795 RepID=UPI00209B1033|nr:class I SAM-dependent methyltransferase [Stieleria tagensis]MCO8125181.1 methyltransferase domain-containing protein [Stieleria tagensis]